MRNGMGSDDYCLRRMLSPVEVAFQLSTMVLVMPSLKYWMNTNPWAFDLTQRYVQQISTTGQDMPPQIFSATARRIISRCKQTRAQRRMLDNWGFVPHYPYPPRGRRWALGMQQGGAKMMLLVHTTHANIEAHGVREQLLVSGSSPMPVYRVMLWYNNVRERPTGSKP